MAIITLSFCFIDCKCAVGAMDQSFSFINMQLKAM